MWKNYYIIETEAELLALLARKDPNARIIAGGTDLMIEMRNHKWENLEAVYDISRMTGADRIWLGEDGFIHLGCLVTHNDVIASKLLREKAWPLYQACWHVATPQIRNTATVAGNLVTASPANDTICPLMAMNADLLLASEGREHWVALSDFYLGVRKTVLQADAYLKEIRFTPLAEDQIGIFKKSALRRAQAIATLNATVVLTIKDGVIRRAAVTLGSVATTIIHAVDAEAALIGKRLTPKLAAELGKLASKAARPISDIRASSAYRSYMLAVLVENALNELREGRKEKIPVRPATLSTRKTLPEHPAANWTGNFIETTINGEEFRLEGSSDRNLLNFLRERVGLTGTKNGCEEGECGACTIHLDDKAVLSCLTPWPRAHNARITTIEGIARAGELHPLQQSFIDHGAVQCGYCTPGFIMSGTKMLEELGHPDAETIKQGISGNICRCTGYYKIVEAIETIAKGAE